MKTEDYRIISVNQFTKPEFLEQKLNEAAKEGYYFTVNLGLVGLLLTKVSKYEMINTSKGQD